MFSALKRLTSRTENGNGSTSGQPGVTGITTMSSSLQKKFSKGVQYNMKIILKGDKNVGKSQLFRRLQGLPFVEEYTQTEEIQAASIQWNYKNSDDVIKVDVWEIVDKASKKKSLPNKLKIENSQSQGEDDGVQEIGLDASFLDVYKNTNGVIFVLDITKSWTFDYIKREINTVPLHIPVLILGNHRDMGHHRAVATDSVHYFIESLERNNIRYAESSMRNGFGLKYIHKFFNLPFLQLQRETLLKQLETNKEENQVTLTELDYYAESDDSNYDLFIENLSQKRRQVADALAPTTSKLSMAEAQAIATEKAMKEGNVAAAVSLASKPSIIDPKENSKTKTNVPTITSALQESAASNLSSTSSIVAGMGANSIPNEESSKVQKEANNKISSSSSVVVGTKSRNGNGNSQQQSSQVNNNSSNINSTASNTNNNSTNSLVTTPIDDFVPDESNGIDKSFFLEESSTPSRSGGGNNRNNNNKINKIPAREFETSEEEDAGEIERVQGNPLVASYEEDFVPETYNSPLFTPTAAASTIPSVEPTTKISDSSDNTINIKKSIDKPSKFCILSSSEEEEVDNKKTLPGGHDSLDFKLNLNLSDLPQSNMDLDLGIFFKKDDDNNDKNYNANDALSEFTSPSSTSNTKHSAKDKDKKSSKKSSSSSASSSKHHKKSSKHKSKSSSKKDRNALDDFLNGSDYSPNNNPHDVDLNAYEAL